MSALRNFYKILVRLFWAAALISLNAAAAEPEVVGADGLSAEAAVNGYITGLLQDIGQIRHLYEADREAYFQGVGTALSAFVDFHEVARGVMAKYGTGPNGATDDQLQRFSEVFRASLIDFYGSALAGLDGIEFQMLPVRREARDPERSSNVRMSISADDGSSFEIQYTMFLNDDRLWKLKNLYVEGVNLRRQYYAQFDSLMVNNDFDIDKVINIWQVTN